MKLQYTPNQLIKVSDVVIPDKFYTRMKTGIEQLDGLFGNGILPGLTFTVTAAPGTGKTTLLLQLLNNLAKQGYKTGYFTGEEDIRQVAFTCRRLNVTEVNICNETDIDVICKMAEELDIVIIDSYPCLTVKGMDKKAERDKYIVEKLINTADSIECAMGVILHVTKTGDYKGSTLLPHAVGANFTLTTNPDNAEERIISSTKNRYGCTVNVIVDFGINGFNFSTCKSVNKVETAPSKVDKYKEQLAKVIAMDEPPGITMQRVMNELECNRSKAYTLLRELVEIGKLVKFGRGDEAVFKHATPTPK